MSQPKSIPLISESQYIGRNAFWFNRRMVLAMFCFGAYFLSSRNKNTSDLLLLVGSSIIGISIVLLFVKHFTLTIFNSCIVIDGLWSTSKVKIDINSIIEAEKVPYSKFLLNNPVYNLHKKGTIRFYSGGKNAIKLTDRDGLVYIIGSQNSDAILTVIKKLIVKK